METNAESGARLDLKTLLKDGPLAEVPRWWLNLPPLYRARGRWCFDEPAPMPQPRQRARRELLAGAGYVTGEGVKAGSLARHHVSNVTTKLTGAHLEAWKEFAYQTSSANGLRVPVPELKRADEVWLRIMNKSHSALLKPGALEALGNWQASLGRITNHPCARRAAMRPHVHCAHISINTRGPSPHRRRRRACQSAKRRRALICCGRSRTT